MRRLSLLSLAPIRQAGFRVHISSLFLIIAFLSGLIFAGSHRYAQSQALCFLPASNPLAALSQPQNDTMELLPAPYLAAPYDEAQSDRPITKYLDELATTASESIVFQPLPLSVVLPISSHNANQLEHTLHGILQVYNTADITILCPPALLVTYRHTLRSMISDALWHDEKLQLTLRAQYASLTDEVILTAREAEGHAILVLDEDLLQDVSLADMVLLDVTFPLGPRGFIHKQCIPGSASASPADYLVPPFFMPPSLTARKFDLTGANSWQDFGAWIARHRDDGIGGAVLYHSAVKEISWCSSASSAPHMTTTELENSDFLRASSYFLGQLPSPSNDSHSVPAHKQPHIGILFTSFEDIARFSGAVCRFSASGFIVNTFIVQPTTQQSHFGSLKTTFCDLKFLALPSDAVPSWLQKPLAVLITTEEAVSSVRDQVSHDTILITIPRTDLPYCDWMGSLSLLEWQNWHKPRFEISIITNNRPSSLERLVHSLEQARFFGDTVTLRVNVEQSAKAATLTIVDSLHDRWGSRGALFVHRRIILGGLLPAVVESWYPSSNDSYGILLEDDVEVSPLFFAWAKMSVLRYRYGSEQDRSKELFGISLYQQKNLELRPEGRSPFNARALFSSIGLFSPATPYLSQIPCSWGAVYFPEHWREFHTYLAERLEAPYRPGIVVPHARSNRWARSWKRYFVELTYVRGYTMLYPNFPDFTSLATNHLETGAHVHPLPPTQWARKKALFEVPLMPLREWSTGLLEMPDGALPAWDDIPVLDLFGEVVERVEMRRRGLERREVIWGCSVTDVPFDVSELMCTKSFGV